MFFGGIKIGTKIGIGTSSRREDAAKRAAQRQSVAVAAPAPAPSPEQIRLAQEAERLRQQEQARQAEERAKVGRMSEALKNIDAAFAPYGQEYFDSLARKYTDFYRSELDKQFSGANEGVLFSLARQGLMNSSAKDGVYNRVRGIYDEEKKQIDTDSRQYADSFRPKIDDQRRRLVLEAQATGGDQQKIGGFLGNAPSLIRVEAPQLPSFSPLGDIFASALPAGSRSLRPNIGPAAAVAGSTGATTEAEAESASTAPAVFRKPV